MVTKSTIIGTMQKLNIALKISDESSELSLYINQTLEVLRKSEGVAFTGAFQQFLNKAPIVKSESNINFNDLETSLWEELFSMRQLGNNLWGLSIGW